MAAKAETAKKAQQLEKLQDLCRSLQLQNRHIKEEDVRKRKDMLDTFNDSIKDIKSKCALCNPYNKVVDAGLTGICRQWVNELCPCSGLFMRMHGYHGMHAAAQG